MNRDPFYHEIERALAGTIDPDQFEKCALDLLRSAYPNLAPVSGGQDGGRDGEGGIGNLGFFLVATSGDPKANLRKSLKSHSLSGRVSRACVLVARKILNAASRAKLEELAASLGYTLVRIHDGTDLAARLYQSPAWCKALLNLTGTPPALSSFAITHRPLLGHELIGRTKDLEWLRAQTGDALVVGQPGSGKTFLLAIWAQEAQALFVRHKDPTEIAAGLRAQKPKALILDDAHLDSEFILTLRQIRLEIGADFRIVANSWPGARESLERNLGITSDSVRNLEPLTRKEIVQIVKSLGIGGPNELIFEIVNQSVGRPGLASTLTQLCFGSSFPSVTLGDELAREIKTTIGRLLGERSVPLLASFAIAGNQGVAPEVVAQFLGLPVVDVNILTSGLAAGGVLEQRSEKLRVLPEQLQFSLVRDVFFNAATPMSFRHLLDLVPDADSATRVLIFAASRGANISPELLRNRVEASDNGGIWNLYASSGREEAEWALENAPSRLLSMAEAGLESAPRAFLRTLLRQAAIEPDDDVSRFSHPLHVVKTWIQKGRSGAEETLGNRRMLIEEAEFWIDVLGQQEIGILAFSIALNPSFEQQNPDPGDGYTTILSFGLLSKDELEELALEWPRLESRLDWTRIRRWKNLSSLLAHWLTPRWIQPDHVNYQTSRKLGWEMAIRLAASAPSRFSVTQWVCSNAGRFKFSHNLSLPDDVEALYPTKIGSDVERELKVRRAQAERLAAIWIQLPPDSVIARWIEILSEMETGEIRDWDQAYQVAFHISVACAPSDLINWCIALKSGGLSRHILPFLQRLVSLKPENWDSVLAQYLGEDEVRADALHALLEAPILAPEIESKVLEAAINYPETVWLSCLRGLVPVPRLKSLLAQENPKISSAVAKGMWSSNAGVPKSLQEAWETAFVTQVDDEEHVVLDVCKKRPDLGLSWIHNQLRSEHGCAIVRFHKSKELISDYAGQKDRLKMISLLKNSFYDEEFIEAVVGSDPVVFIALLKRNDLRHLHQMPLRGDITEKWIINARTALEAGWTPSQIAHSVWAGSGGYSLPASRHWAEWEVKFKGLEKSAPDLTEVAKAGWAEANRLKEQCLISERRLAVFGE